MFNEFLFNEGMFNQGNSDLALTAFSVISETGFNKCLVTAGGARVEIWRQYPGGEARCLTRTLPVGTGIIFYDYNVIAGLSALYWAVAVDGSGSEITSGTVTALQTFGGAYLHKVVRADTTTKEGDLLLLNNQEGASRSLSVAYKKLMLPAYDKPNFEISTTLQGNWRIPLILPDLTDTTRRTMNAWAMSHAVLCCRDERGRLMFGIVQRVKESLDLYGQYPFELWQVDFREHILAA